MSSQESDSEEELNRNYEVTSSPSQEFLLPLLECPVCLNLPVPPIRTCSLGHIICATCCAKLSRCPLCAKPIGAGRNFFAETFFYKSTVRCKYAEDGCKTQLPGENLKKHLIDCKFRPVRCTRCNSKILFANFEDHLQSAHSIGRWDLDDCGTQVMLEERRIRFNEGVIQFFSNAFLFKALAAASALSFLADLLLPVENIEPSEWQSYIAPYLNYLH